MSFYFSWISPFAPGDPMCFQDGRGQSTVALRDFESGEAIDILGHHFKGFNIDEWKKIGISKQHGIILKPCVFGGPP